MRDRSHIGKLLALTLMLTVSVALTACFPHNSGPRLAHFETVAPSPGDAAPGDLELYRLDGTAVTLAELVGDKPLVLQLGSHTCPVYRYRRHWMDGLVEDFADRVDFRIVYTQEAHPKGSKSPFAEGEWVSMVNRVTGVLLPQPETLAARIERARYSQDKLGLPQPMLVDGMDNLVWQTYGAASSPAFVIDRRGEVVLAQVWIEPRAIRQTLERLLADDG